MRHTCERYRPVHPPSCVQFFVLSTIFTPLASLVHFVYNTPMPFVRVGRSLHVGYSQFGPDDCWPWRASCTGQGYGQAFNRRTGRVDKAHRVVYELLTGTPVPPRASGLELHHVCRNRRCVNPAHLQIVTVAVNRALRVPAVRKPVPITHGSISGYAYHQCRCDPCRARWAAYYKSYRATRRFGKSSPLRT